MSDQHNDVYKELIKKMDKQVFFSSPRGLGKSKALEMMYGKNPCEEVYMDWETQPPTIKTMKPKGGTVGLLRDTTSGIEPYFDYKQLQVRNIMNNGQVDNSTPDTRRADPGERKSEIMISGNQLTGELRIEDETATLKVVMPGVPKDELEVRRIDNTLRIRINPKDKRSEYSYASLSNNIRQLYVNLHPDDVVGDVRLALGILTVEIDLDREVYEIQVIGE